MKLRTTENKWECYDCGLFDVYRLKIYGGWLVKTDNLSCDSLIFIEDREHKWDFKID